MLKKSLLIAALAIALGAFLYYQPFLFSKGVSARIIDRLPDADFIGRLKILELTKETTDLLYFYKIPFRDLTSAEYLLGQGKTFGLNLQKPIYIFANKNKEWGALILINDAEKAKQGIEKLKQNIVVNDSTKRKVILYFIPKLNLYLHYSDNYLLLYSGKKIHSIISRVKNAKYKSISPLWKGFLANSTFKNENLVFYTKWAELKNYDVDYAMFAHDSDTNNFNVKCYFHKKEGVQFPRTKKGLSYIGQENPLKSIEIHLDAEKFRATKNNPLKNLLIEKGKKLSFPVQSFMDSWKGVLSFREGGKQQVAERIIVSEMDADFNVTQVEKFRNIEVPGYSLLFNTNEKGPEFINALLQKGILRSEGNQYRVLFSPLLNMKIKDDYYFFYSGAKNLETTLNEKNELLWPIQETNFYFKIDAINDREVFGSIKIPANKIVKQLLSIKL